MSRLPDPAYAPLPGNTPPRTDHDAFDPVDTGGAVDTLYANSGIVTHDPSTAAKRRLSDSLPWSDQPRRKLRKLTHFRAPGMGDAMWSGACTYDLAGGSPSFSYYDDPDDQVKDDNLSTRISGGNITHVGNVEASEYTTTRRARLAAHQDSAPASAIFQGYFNPRWSGLLAGFRPQIQPRPLHANFNPNAMGSKELHKATQYKPVPPMGSIVGYFGTEKAI